MRPRIDSKIHYLCVLSLLQFFHLIQRSRSQITSSGFLPLDDPPTFVISSFGYKSDEVSPRPPLIVEITVGDPAIPGMDLTGFEYEVTWFAQDEVTPRRRKVTRQLTSSGNDVIEKLGFSSTGNNGYRLGEEIHAEFRVRYYRLNGVDSSTQDVSPWSELVTSPKYKTGILITPDGDINAKECSENYTKITVTLKTPVNCPTGNNCVLGIKIFLERIPGTAFYWTSRQEVAISSCHISLDNSFLDKQFDIYLKGICDSVDENDDEILLRFEYTQSTYFWNSFNLPQKKIKISDSLSRWCTYQGDPHMQTFDGLSYSYFGIGDFVLYKNKQLNLEINARLWPCASQGASCICGIAIREGNDVLVLKGCNINRPWKFRVILKRALPSTISSIQVLKELSTNNKFYVFLYSGAEVILTHTYNPEAQMSWVNAMIRVPDQGRGGHQGMCGNYDGIIGNDLTNGGDDKDYTGDPSGFGASWSLAFNKDSWFEKIPTSTAITQRQMCSCGTRAGWWSESKPTLATRCSYSEENHFLAIRRSTEDITESLRTNSRVQRAEDEVLSDIFVEESDGEGEFDLADFAGYVMIKGLTWPTASGLSEIAVYRYCRGVIFGSSGAGDCQNLTTQRNIGNSTVLLMNCVKDIQITDQLFWSSSALSTFQSQCEEAHLEEYAETSANETTSIQSDGTQAVLDFLVLVPKEIVPVCPGDCSGNGSCAQGSCMCNKGRTGLDCSLRLDQAPVLKGIYSDGLCDIRTRACQISRVNGFGFVNSPESKLACHVEGFEVFNSTWNGSIEAVITSALLIDLYQVQCDLLRHPVSRDGSPYVRGTPVVGMNIFVSNDGRKVSNKQILIIYDGLCLNCTAAGNCVLKIILKHVQIGTCLINGRCYADGHIHPSESTKSCQPDISTTNWTETPDNIGLKKEGRDTTVIIIAGVIVPFVLLTALAVTLRCWIVGARRGRAEIDNDGTHDDFYFHY